MPGVQGEEFRQRRTELAQRVLPPNALALIPAYKTRYSSLNIFYPFQQNNNLLYLTGFEEPNSALVVHKDANGHLTSTMFVQENNAHTLLWSGPCAGAARTKAHFGVDQALPFDSLAAFLGSAARSRCTIYADLDENACVSLAALGIAGDVVPISGALHKLRVVKSAAEGAVVRGACRVGAEAFRETMRWGREGTQEAHLAARMEYECRLRDATGLAYVPVVAGGDRGNIIHYVRNDRPIERGSLVLMDAGAKVNGYCSDITRTWPISGRFTAPQRELYEAVLRVQQRCIVGAAEWPRFPEISLQTLNDIANVLFVDELGRLGFARPERAVDALFPHSIGHYMGLDLHDCPSVPAAHALQPGMVITIEPGLYVPAHPDYPARYHGLAVRIEDDILVTAEGCDVLTDAVPKEVAEIESLLLSAE